MHQPTPSPAAAGTAARPDARPLHVRFTRSLFGQVLIALVLGVVLGLAAPEFAAKLKPLGDAFIKLIKMLIGPIVFCVVVAGICGAGELKKVGRVGVKAVIYFEIVTTIALALGIALAYVFQPGAGMNVNPASLDASAMSAYVDNASKMASGGTVDFLLKLIPGTMVGAFANGDVLQVLLISVLFGCALSLTGETGKPLVRVIDNLSQTLFKMMSFIIKLAPLGVLGAVAFTVGKYGIGSLKQLGFLVVLFYGAVVMFVLVVLGTVMRMAGFSVLKLIRYLRAELLVVLGTASSDSVLPQVMRKLEFMGIRKSVVGLVIPTGYSFNLDAFSIYLTLAAVFIAQATNTPLAMGDLLGILAVALVTSKGAHGIPGSAIVILAATLSAHPAIPAIGLVLVLSVDWFIGIARAVGNLVGNCVATVVVAAWEKDIDRERAHGVLNGTIAATELEEGMPAPAPLAPGLAPEVPVQTRAGMPGGAAGG
ncbi:C4-dicarboxylate transporter DctA [Cupriavidus respiraculi]|uniref:C4-dicarboxylate transporter DctA n=1 Tax=Cupriavidus respiraculi TaxID=195930 RepID=UPI001C988F93|nr:C4-dicarboxylate transporter DctA [Cupriavidus respiraculi]MBY4946576.1 C4-dicarboxylate transporter DctA [Cupriavidus respiraculi]